MKAAQGGLCPNDLGRTESGTMSQAKGNSYMDALSRTGLSGPTLQKHTARDEINGQPVLSHYSRADEDRVAWHKSGLRGEHGAVKWEFNFVSVFDASLPARQNPLGGSNKRAFTSDLNPSGNSRSPLKPVSTVAGQLLPPTSRDTVGTPSIVTVPRIIAGLPCGRRSPIRRARNKTAGRCLRRAFDERCPVPCGQTKSAR